MASLLLTLLLLAPMSLAGENSIILAESQRVVQRRMDTGDTRVLVTATQTDTVGWNFEAIAVDDNFNFYVSVERKVFRVSYFEEWAKLPTTDDITVIMVDRYVYGLEYDRQSGQLFGSDFRGIFKMNPDGSDVEVVTTFEEVPGDVVISGGFLYWNTRTYGARDNIFLCPIDNCSNPERLHDSDIDMYERGFDVNGDCVFWADRILDQFVVTDVLTGSQTRLMSFIDFPYVFSISFHEGALYYTDYIRDTLNVCYLHECFNIMSGLAEPRDFEFTSPVDGSSCSVLDDSEYSMSTKITSTMTPDSSSTIKSTITPDSSKSFMERITDGLTALQKAFIGLAAGICSVDIIIRIIMWIMCGCCVGSTSNENEYEYENEITGSERRIERRSVSSAANADRDIAIRRDTMQLQHSMDTVSTLNVTVNVENLHVHMGATDQGSTNPQSLKSLLSNAVL